MSLARVAPMLATAGRMPDDDDSWGFEIKWDGVRALAYIDGDALRLDSRNLLDITPRYPELHGLVAALAGRRAVLDGEVVAFDEHGRPSFQALQARMHLTRDRDVQVQIGLAPVTFLVFDVLWLDDRSLLDTPYRQRRAALDGLGLDGGSWQVPGWHEGGGPALLAATRAQGLEGVVAKKLDSRYEPGKRSARWLKIKNQRRQEVVIGGWLAGAGHRSNRLGALLVGVYDDAGALRYCGRVGTGFTDAALADMGRRLAEITRPSNPFAEPVPVKQAQFVEPVLVCDVEFTEWTQGGTLRHPSFKGLRADKAPRDVTREPEA